MRRLGSDRHGEGERRDPVPQVFGDPSRPCVRDLSLRPVRAHSAPIQATSDPKPPVQRLGLALACSLAIWTLLFTINYLIFSGIGVTTSLVLVVLASSVFSLLTSIPIQGIVGLGTTEAFWTVALIAIGIPSETAIIAGFVQHLIALIYISLLGVYGLFARPQ